MNNLVSIEELAPYARELENEIIRKALEILGTRVSNLREVMSSPQSVKDYICLRIGGLPHEVFGMLFLDAQNRIIEAQEMFRGTLTQTSVYPREVVIEALRKQAASVVLYHNHPSGTVQPSRADEALTQALRAALALIDVRVLDHVIVSGDTALSMAEKGLM